MKRLRLAAALLCALLMLSLPVMADGFGTGDFDSDTVNKNPQVDNPNEVTPTPSTEPPQEPTGDGAGNNAGDAAGTNSAGTENGNSSQLDDGLWGDWSNPSNIPGMEEPSEAQQELEEARRELEEKQQQRDEAFREAERELRRNMYHNTQRMLKDYRDIVWMAAVNSGNDQENEE